MTAVASREIERSQNYISELQSLVPFETPPIAIESYDALIANENVDAVYVPLPTGLRKEWVIQAAESGKHVLCEKPCAVSAKELHEMIDACERNNVQFMDGVMYMHSSRMDVIRDALDDGKMIGRTKRITSQFSFLAPEEFRSGNIRTNSELEPQGCLGDLGWYTIRFSLWVMGYEMPVRVSGRILDEHHRADSPNSVPMEFSGELFFDNGVSASFYNSFVTEHQQWANVSGTKGLLHVSDFVLPYENKQNVDSNSRLSFAVSNSNFAVNGCRFEMLNNTRNLSVVESSDGAVDSQETKLFRKFNELVLSGTVDSHWPAIALKTQIVMDACLQSGRSGGKLVAL